MVSPGELWGPLCNAYGDCSYDTHDEGTPQILYKLGQYFYVTFHGFYQENGEPRFVRGVARTVDFSNWETSGAELPGRPMFMKWDCPWQPGCIGGGAATMVASESYHYMLIETPTWNDPSDPMSEWQFGLVRSPGLAATGEWESYDWNPLIPPSVPFTPCTPGYASFFADGDELYLMYQVWDDGLAHSVQRFERIVADYPGDTLHPGEALYPGDSLYSGDGRYFLVYQWDGNLVLYQTEGGAIWSSNTWMYSAGYAVMQWDGNFVVYDAEDVPRFATNTDGNVGSYLLVQNDSNLVVYSAEGWPLWHRPNW